MRPGSFNTTEQTLNRHDTARNESKTDVDQDRVLAITFFVFDSVRSELIQHLKRPRLFANNNEAIIKLFENGVGFGTLTQEIAQKHLLAGSLIALNGGKVKEELLAAAWYPRLEMPRYFQAVLKVLK